MNYTEIIIIKKTGEFDAPLTYKAKEDACVGQIVKIPLRNKIVHGIIVDIKSNPPKDIDINKIKNIEEITSFTLDEKQIRLAKKIADYYQTSLARALRLMIPTAIWKGKLDEPYNIYYKLISSGADAKGVKQKEVIKTLSESIMLLGSELNASMATINSLIKKGIIEEIKKSVYEKPDYKIFPLKSLHHKLNHHQEDALKEIRLTDKPILLHGITGSGKTELYLKIILDSVSNGRQAILLVPEIALTPQMIDYFKDYFGEYLALFHSKLSDNQRAEEWWKVKTGYAPLVIGSRSAIFAPADDLGIVILDEEHEWTYKQESAPYYQTHHVGEMLSGLFGSKLVLGSATPRIESLHKAKTGEYKYLQLSERINEKDLPKIQIIDLRDEFKQKNYSVLSRALKNKMQERLEKKEQIILFVNQRGVASAVVCRDCGYTESCPHCEVSLKYHKGFNTKPDSLICHYCNFTKSPSITCPECKSPYIKHVGVGTQKVEEDVRRFFPEARVIRADKDTTDNKDGFSPIYKSFKEGKYDILIGTQMVAKGLDFENVSLIGIILADIGLHIPDFRSHERLFQLITQVSGRCGRGKAIGEVVLQTYQPEHFAIQKAAKYEYDEFIDKELGFREKLRYPPFNNLIKFTIVGRDLEKLRQHIEIEEQILEDIFKVNNLDFKIISAPAMIPKISDRYYYHILIRSKNPHIIFSHWKPPKYWRIDVDPIHTT